MPEIDSKQESESRPEDQTPQITEPAAQRLPSRYQLGNALKSIMRNKIGPSESWQSHQQTQFENKFKGNGGNPKLDDSYEFSASGSGVEVFAKSADGSHLVKMKGGCYSIGKDQWGDDLWTPTPCPNSADPYRKLLKDEVFLYSHNRIVCKKFYPSNSINLSIKQYSIQQNKPHTYEHIKVYEKELTALY